MHTYTQLLDDKAYTILDEDDFVEELKKVLRLFKTFDKSLDEFMSHHGYDKERDDIEVKVSFLKEKFISAGITPPRFIKEWYTKHKVIKRETAFLICFALELNIDEVNDFLRRVCLTRGFDFHVIEEIVYYYSFKNGLSYAKTKDILSRIDKVKLENQPKNEEVVYTDLIINEVEDIESEDELVNYINGNISKFGYNNVSAYEAIKDVWKQIAGPNGLAVREKKYLYDSFGKDEDYENALGRKVRKRIDDSRWEIYLQILGLAGISSSKYYSKRSIKDFIKDSSLIHPLAQESFPDRDGLTKILNGERVLYERVRKQMILLAFYRFWVSKALDKKLGNAYDAEYEDDSRCISDINNFMTDNGYPTLYAGNPFDFIILLSLNSECPLITFRDYMREMISEREI